MSRGAAPKGARRHSRFGWLIAAAVVVWAFVTVAVVLQWRVYPNVGDGDCGTILAVVTERAHQRGCDARAALLAGIGLTSTIFLGPVVIVGIVRRCRRSVRRPE
ncbi:MAG: hypothetical protein QOE45_1739 [Frankiaceae bacterium]|jgi:hypothetical protein|nr:hypothetical protein [Frankiaceae bacterium]